MESIGQTCITTYTETNGFEKHSFMHLSTNFQYFHSLSACSKISNWKLRSSVCISLQNRNILIFFLEVRKPLCNFYFDYVKQTLKLVISNINVFDVINTSKSS